MIGLAGAPRPRGWAPDSRGGSAGVGQSGRCLRGWLLRPRLSGASPCERAADRRFARFRLGAGLGCSAVPAVQRQRCAGAPARCSEHGLPATAASRRETVMRRLIRHRASAPAEMTCRLRDRRRRSARVAEDAIADRDEIGAGRGQRLDLVERRRIGRRRAPRTLPPTMRCARRWPRTTAASCRRPARRTSRSRRRPRPPAWRRGGLSSRRNRRCARA